MDEKTEGTCWLILSLFMGGKQSYPRALPYRFLFDLTGSHGQFYCWGVWGDIVIPGLCPEPGLGGKGIAAQSLI